MTISATLRGQKGAIRLSGDAPRAGGQALVYRGWDAEDRAVAVKIARAGALERRGLLAEREALDAIHRRQAGSERWLVPLLDQGELPDGRPFLVLPWVERSLKGWLYHARPDLRRRIEALILASEAVIQLHRSANSLAEVVLHRDIKPENLLVEEGPEGLRVLLADLGTVKERTLHGATANTGIHSPLYAPLDQMLPVDRAPDPSVDVHALAVTIFFGLVEREPQAVHSRTGLLTSAGEELCHLHEAGGGETEAARARYAELRRAPLERLVDIPHAVVLPAEDLNRLHAALEAHLEREGAEAAPLAEALTAILAPGLRHALEVDPARRLSRPEVLLAALNAALDQLGGASPNARAAVTPDAPAAGATAPPDPPRLRRIAALAAFLSVCGLGLCLGGVTWVVRGVEEEVAAATQDATDTTVAASPPDDPPEPDQLPRTADGLPSAAPVAAERAPSTVRRATSPATTPAVIALPPTTPPPADPPPPPLAPARVIISHKADGDAIIQVNGQESAHAFRGALGAGQHTVTIRSAALQKERSFQLNIVQEGERWRLSLEDPQGEADPPHTVAPGAPIRVRWSLDDRLRFEE